MNRKIDIDRFVETLKACYRDWDAPVITAFSNAGATPFQVLVSTVLSLRTKDEVTAAASRRLFERAPTPEALVALPVVEIEKRIFPVGFYRTKAARLVQISRIILDTHHGEVPATIEALLRLPGVGRKTANLVLVEGFGIPAVCVDVHVHRISNRIGYVATRSPDETESVLRRQLPKPYWIVYNELLVAFGQVICRPVSPYCSRCPVSDMCPRVGIDRHR